MAKATGAARRYDATIPAADGSRLAAEIWPSHVPGSHRAVVFVHGFCGNRSENGLFNELAAACAARGQTAVLYDWRGLGGSEGDFCSASLGDHITDFKCVTQWVRGQFGGVVQSQCAVGFSLGAAVIGSALRDETILSSVVYLSPAVRPRDSMWPRYDTPRIMRELAARGVVKKPDSSVLLGEPILTSLRTTDLGPSAFDLDVPLLVCHGTADSRIDYAHTQALVATRRPRSRGVSEGFRCAEFPGASHSFRPNDRHWQRLSSIVTDWFTEHAPRGAKATEVAA